MESQLVSFGNYLFSNYHVHVHSSDGKNTPLYIRQVTDADISNWEYLNPVVKDESKIMECLHIIEGIFHGYGIKEGLETDLTMANTGSHIYFQLYEGLDKSPVSSSEPLLRTWLESLDHLELTKVILDSLNMLTGKGGGGVPYKKHTDYPSRYSIGEKVKLYLMPEGEETFPGINAKVTAVHFTAGKVKYDLEIKFYGDYTTRVYNIDSILVRDLDEHMRATEQPTGGSGTAKILNINTFTNETKA